MPWLGGVHNDGRAILQAHGREANTRSPQRTPGADGQGRQAHRRQRVGDVPPVLNGCCAWARSRRPRPSGPARPRRSSTCRTRLSCSRRTRARPRTASSSARPTSRTRGTATCTPATTSRCTARCTPPPSGTGPALSRRAPWCSSTRSSRSTRRTTSGSKALAAASSSTRARSTTPTCRASATPFCCQFGVQYTPPRRPSSGARAACGRGDGAPGGAARARADLSRHGHSAPSAPTRCADRRCSSRLGSTSTRCTTHAPRARRCSRRQVQHARARAVADRVPHMARERAAQD